MIWVADRHRFIMILVRQIPLCHVICVRQTIYIYISYIYTMTHKSSNLLYHYRSDHTYLPVT